MITRKTASFAIMNFFESSTYNIEAYDGSKDLKAKVTNGKNIMMLIPGDVLVKVINVFEEGDYEYETMVFSRGMFDALFIVE